MTYIRLKALNILICTDYFLLIFLLFIGLIMQKFKGMKRLVVLGTALAMLNACDSAPSEAESLDASKEASALEGSNAPAAETVSAEAPVEEIKEPVRFIPGNYHDLSQPTGAETVKNLYLKLAATQLDDASFAMAHNIEGAYSSNAFEQKAAAEKVGEFKAKALAYDVPKDGKLVVAMLPGNLVDQLRSEESVTSITTAGLKLLDYDFDKKAFPYTYSTDQSCLNSTQVYNNIPSEVNVIKTGLGGFNVNGIDIKIDRERRMEKTCYFPVADEALAAQIESARVAGKVAFTGKAYLTPKDIVWTDRGSYGVSTTINANVDAEELYLHTVEPDGSLSTPLATHTFIFQ